MELKFQKNGTLLYIFETVVHPYIFCKNVLLGHFGLFIGILVLVLVLKFEKKKSIKTSSSNNSHVKCLNNLIGYMIKIHIIQSD